MLEFRLSTFTVRTRHGRAVFGFDHLYSTLRGASVCRSQLLRGLSGNGRQGGKVPSVVSRHDDSWNPKTDPKRRLEPSGYYYPTGPVGQVFSVFSKTYRSGSVAIVGLGTGALACEGTRSQKFTFYEIDPLVEQIARDANLFTFLRDCPPQINVVIGDARISLAQASDRQYRLFVLDAFSSDVIPVHLLTREALQLYLSKLDEDGILFFHISNRYMNLVPVLDRLASNLSLLALVRHDDQPTQAERDDGKFPSRWVVMARRQAIHGVPL